LFDGIILESHQQDLFMTIVEAARSVSLDKRRKFLVAQTHQGDFLVHPGVPASKQLIYYGDIEALADEGLLRLDYGSNSPVFDVRPYGLRYYEHLKAEAGEPVERVESFFRSHVDSESFRNRFPDAFALWTRAEELLWKGETEEHYTTIGHICREAIQEFADVLARQYEVAENLPDKARTIGRLKAVIEKQRAVIPSTVSPFLGVLVNYWSSVNDLIQRQEHGAQREGQELTWEDARRVVFAALVLLTEIDRALAD
jgi:hypothetical protein